MATLPNIEPSYPVRKTSKPIAKIVQFGDGYIQRTVFGLNQTLKSYAPKWNNISETDADTITEFLDARANDSASFDWTPPDTTTSYKWVCASWIKSIPYLNRATISATFRQVFEA